MNIIFRSLLAFYAFCLTVISLITMIFTLRPEMLEGASGFLVTNVLSDRGFTVLLFIIEHGEYYDLPAIYKKHFSRENIGMKYKFVYAKRTKLILYIEPVDDNE